MAEIPLHFHLPLLALLLTADLILIGCHIVAGMLLPRIPPWLNIAHDHSLPEFLCYAEMIAASAIMVRAYRHNGTALCLGFAGVLLVMMLDDSLQLHEIIGARVAEFLHIEAFGGVAAKDSGEIIAWAILGGILVLIGTAGLARTPIASWPRFYMLTGLVGLLGFFAVGIDFLHDPVCAAASGLRYCSQIFDLVEDGGEMIAVSLILAHVLVAFPGRRPARSGLNLFRQ